MSDPWLTIIGLTEDGLTRLSRASLDAIDAAEIIFGGPRHLALVGAGARGEAWPVPFKIDPILAQKGRPTVVLTSGDPFWFGAGSRIAEALPSCEFVTHSAPSVVSLACAQLGWPLQDTLCFGLHAAPFERMIRVLSDGARIITTLRDANSPAELALWLTQKGFGATEITLFERLGGFSARITTHRAESFALLDCDKLVVAALNVKGPRGLPAGFGLPDALFASDGQITKQPIRAITLASLAPRAGEMLWDLGAGSGSISAEWCLNGGRACAVETREDRAKNIRENARAFGLEHRMTCQIGQSLALIETLPAPDAVFIGGGASAALIEAVWSRLPIGGRLVVNSVTLETEALLVAEQARRGGRLMRIDIAETEPLGRMRGWAAARPLVHWSVAR